MVLLREKLKVTKNFTYMYSFPYLHINEKKYKRDEKSLPSGIYDFGLMFSKDEEEWKQLYASVHKSKV